MVEGVFTESSSPAGDDDSQRPRRAIRLLALILICAVAVIAVRALLVQSFVVPSGSMTPTVHTGDRVLVWRPAAFFGEPQRGEIIVFDGDGVFDPEPAPGSALAQLGKSIAAAVGMPVGRHDYVKRVIGLPGERVTCCDAQGRIMIDGKPLDEPYLPAGEEPSRVRFDIVVPPGRLWVMGDARSQSSDSRSHLGSPGGGTVPVKNVVGRVVAVWWPFSHGEVLADSSVDHSAAGSGSESARGSAHESSGEADG